MTTRWWRGCRAATIVAVAGGVSACAGHPPGSAECVARPVASLPLGFVGNVPFVNATLDGHPVALMIDLGSNYSVLTEAAATRLQLPRTPVDIRMMVGVGGFSRRLAATADHLRIGALDRPDQRFEVADARLGTLKIPIDGLIGLDVLRRFDLDLDMPHARVALNKPSGCDGPPPGWEASAVRVPVRNPVPGNTLMGLPATLDGRDVTALLDSGASMTMIGGEAARHAGYTAGTDASGPPVALAGVGDEHPTATRYRIRSLGAGGDTVANGLFMVGPVMPYFDLILGADFLHVHRVWIPADAGAVWFGPRALPAKVAAAP